MELLKLGSRLMKYASAAEFLSEMAVGDGDLIVSNRYIFEPAFGALPAAARIVYQEDFGHGEPTDEMFESMCASVGPLSAYRRIIGIGGGTVMDMAKLMALSNPLPAYGLFSKSAAPVKDKRLVLVPTTCGTGSEVTNVSVMAFPSRSTKLSLLDDALYADCAALVDGLLAGLPYPVFATSSIDALVHAVESFLSPKATVFSQVFSCRAISMIIEGYRRVYSDGQAVYLKLLDDFAVASNLAGIAFNTAGCAGVHAMSYPLSGTFHVPHGEANYAMFMAVMKKYVELAPQRIMPLYRAMATPLGCRTEDALHKLEGLLTVILANKRLSMYGADEAIIAEWADSVMANQTRLMSNCLVPLSHEHVLGIYKSAL